MREIKFRGKDKDGRWWHGSYLYLPDSDSHHIMPYGTYKPSTETLVVEYVEVDPATVGQYTGLKDRNGKEIYEGDILHFHGKLSTTVKEIDIRVVVVWDERRLLFGYNQVLGNKLPSDAIMTGLLININVGNWEIIGNIHDDGDHIAGISKMMED